MIGLKQGTVRLATYTSDWNAMFRTERRRIRARFPSRTVAIQHIGSTAVPGLDAKPIIDIAVQIASFKRLNAYIRRFVALGYEYKGEYGLPGRHFFVRGNPATQHVHLVERGSAHWARWLLFRDYLRAFPAEARRYNAFKRNLARRYAQNRDAYTRAKTPFVERMLARAAKKRSKF
jgi:GrpB-like predicted nucleotidyltransferase (UPF0157 family)